MKLEIPATVTVPSFSPGQTLYFSVEGYGANTRIEAIHTSPPISGMFRVGRIVNGTMAQTI